MRPGGTPLLVYKLPGPAEDPEDPYAMADVVHTLCVRLHEYEYQREIPSFETPTLRSWLVEHLMKDRCLDFREIYHGLLVVDRLKFSQQLNLLRLKFIRILKLYLSTQTAFEINETQVNLRLITILQEAFYEAYALSLKAHKEMLINMEMNED